MENEYVDDGELLLTLEDEESNPKNGNNLNDERQIPAPQSAEEPNTASEPQRQEQSSEFDLITEALKARGIADPNNIKFETELGIENRKFEDLSNEEKLEILNLSPNDLDLGAEEITAVNFLREHNISFKDAVEYFKHQGVQEYLNSNTSYEVDSLEDDDIYRMELQNNFEDFTEEEIEMELNAAKANPDLYKKKVDKLREYYKEQELKEKEASESAQTEELQRAKEKFIEEFQTYGKQLTSIGGIDLEEEDYTTTYEYAFKPTLNGASQLANDINDPKKLYKLAFFMAHGDELISHLHTVYREELNKLEKEYLKVLPKNQQTQQKSSKVVTKPSKPSSWDDDMKNLWSLKE